MTNIKVSVLTPIYNHDIKYVRECLESLCAQTLQELELILIDNGANQESKDLIEEFAQKDSRFKVLHIEKNEGYGKAMNLGLKEAKGKYIGIVESDDLIHQDMYKDLYDAGLKSNADLIKGLFSFYENNTIKNVGISFLPEQYNKLLKPIQIPDFCDKYGAYWSAIYKKETLIKNDIEYDIMPSPSAEDIMFTLKTFCLFETLFIVNKSYYYHRMDNVNSSIHRKDPIVHNCIKLYDKLNNFFESKKELITSDLWKIKNRREFFNLYLHYIHNNVTKKRFNYILKISKRFKKMSLTNNIILPPKYQPIFNEITYRPVLFYLNSEIKYKETLKKIFSVKNSQNKKHKIITILGIKIKIKNKTTQNNNLNFINNTNAQYYDMQKCNIEAAALHPIIFKDYQNKYVSKDIAIVACGPTASYYAPIKNSINIGVNRAFKLNNVKLNYLFVQDWIDEEDMTVADKYLPDFCKKFYAVISDFRLSQVYPKIKRIPQYHINNANASTYILKSDLKKEYPFDISINPISDLGGTVFSALQFALYTNPRRIYLIGCDCSSGHFHKEGLVGLGPNLQGQIPWWKHFKQHVSNYWPQTEIISINPVGLKGMFKDVYTQSYVDEHPELLEEDIEIIDIKEKVEV